MQKIKLNKSNLNKIIKMSSSRYNTHSKKSNVEFILKCMNQGFYKMGDDIVEEMFFTSGSYCECSAMTRSGEYIVNFKNKTIIDCLTDEIVEEPGYKINKIYQEWKLI